MRQSLATLLSLGLVAAVACGAVAAEGGKEVDLALVLAVDVSRSMDPDEQQLQREGYVEALRSPAVHAAIRKGAIGRIAVAYVEWSGVAEQKVVMPWTVIEGAASANAFADQLAEAPIGRVYSTSISAAIDFSVRLLEQSGFDAERRVIDISGDGPNNTGRAVNRARDEAVAADIIINGLPFMLKRPNGFGDMENLDRYYEDCVIGGVGAFVVPIRSRTEIIEATRTKLIREISAAPDPEPAVVPAQGRESVNCMIGEMRRQQQWGP
ncbi:DUF1194 domain-containing protein [Prosthecomicrobium sp. N25]|uniref:DUF1194 domain-containing protein n=1 Tax=Prosthecomicrobium sp. N25 TaxID=3129254 RepID=UPI003077AD17